MSSETKRIFDSMPAVQRKKREIHDVCTRFVNHRHHRHVWNPVIIVEFPCEYPAHHATWGPSTFLHHAFLISHFPRYLTTRSKIRALILTLIYYSFIFHYLSIIYLYKFYFLIEKNKYHAKEELYYISRISYNHAHR